MDGSICWGQFPSFWGRVSDSRSKAEKQDCSQDSRRGREFLRRGGGWGRLSLPAAGVWELSLMPLSS